ncbi:MAG: hypothetical protein ACT4NP_01545 [Pseudonocardiales bacterium]
MVAPIDPALVPDGFVGLTGSTLAAHLGAHDVAATFDRGLDVLIAVWKEPARRRQRS